MGKIILITGISSGFGKKTAEYLAGKGHTVYGTIRREAETDPAVKVLFMDLTDPESIKKAADTVLEKEGRIDVLINNAGMHLGGPIEFTPPEDFKLLMSANFFGMVHLIQAVLPSMRKQGKGIIINISSIGGLIGLPFQGFYSSSKFAIEGLSEALRMELHPFNIRVIVINPGDFHTNNTMNRKNITFTDDRNTYMEQFKRALSVIEKDETGGWDPQIMARRIYRIIESKNPKDQYIIGSFISRLGVIIKPFLPVSFFSRLIRSIYGK